MNNISDQAAEIRSVPGPDGIFNLSGSVEKCRCEQDDTFCLCLSKPDSVTISENQQNEYSFWPYLAGGIGAAILIELIRRWIVRKIKAKDVPAEPIKPKENRVRISDSPSPDHVEYQLRRLWGSVSDLKDVLCLFPHLAKTAIEEWSRLPFESKKLFVESDENTIQGELPREFLKHFLDEENWSVEGREKLRALAYVALHIADNDPMMKGVQPSKIRKRAAYLLEVWNKLPGAIQREEFGYENGRGFPDSFIEFMGAKFVIGEDPATVLIRQQHPWNIKQLPSAQGSDATLLETMDLLIQENEDLAFYPSFLELRAKALMIDWKMLTPERRRSFSVQERRIGRDPDKSGIPKIYVIVWHLSTFGLGKLVYDKTKRKGGNGNGEGGPGSAAPDVSGTFGFSEGNGPAGGSFSGHNYSSMYYPQVDIRPATINFAVVPTIQIGVSFSTFMCLTPLRIA